MSSQEILKEVAVEVSTCTRCDLCKSRTRAVPGEGNPHAKILFIGEGPGLHEDKQGRPFVGPSGQLLQELLKSINLKREDVFITNVVKCRPPDNRDPLPAEIDACNDYLDRQIAAIQPLVIVTLGLSCGVRAEANKAIPAPVVDTPPAETLQAHKGQHLDDTLRDFGSRRFFLPQAEANVALDREMREQRIALEHHVDRPPMRLHSGDIFAIEQDASFGGRLETGEHT